VLLAYGRDGLANMFAKQVRLARGIARFLNNIPDYILLAQEPHGMSTSGEESIANPNTTSEAAEFPNTHIVVLFRAKNDTINADLVQRINGTRKMYVSGTKWDGKPACRIAVSTWKVDVERDVKLVTDVLQQVLISGS
jgi:glutamate/tyrosine decarboxylase-like PLP-dependent enzyme